MEKHKGSIVFRDVFETRVKQQNNQIAHHKTLPVGIDISNWTDKQLEEGYDSIIPINTTEFKDIKWTKDYNFREDGYAYSLIYRALVGFDNGYAASIVNGMHTEGKYFEYEIALMDNEGICYNSPDAPFDVQGYLTEEEVSDYLKIISKLKPIKTNKQINK